jgi:hypothetical protein
VSSVDSFRLQAVKARLRGWRGKALVLGPPLVLLVVVGVAAQSPTAGIYALVLALLGTFGLLWSWAGREAIRRALAAWGTPRGLAAANPAPKPAGMKWVDGTRGKMGPGLTGPLAGGDGGLGHFTYTTGSGKDREEHPFTLCWTRVAAADQPTAVSLGPRELGGLFDGILGAFSSWHEVELESVEFEHRFSLWAADRSDELAVRRFFTPLMIARCIDEPPLGRLEIAGGILCLSLATHLVEPGDLDQAAAELERWALLLRERAAVATGDAGSARA